MIAEESLRRMSIHEDERNANSYHQQHSSRSNSVQPQDLYHDQPPPRNAYARSNVSQTFSILFSSIFLHAYLTTQSHIHLWSIDIKETFE